MKILVYPAFRGGTLFYKDMLFRKDLRIKRRLYQAHIFFSHVRFYKAIKLRSLFEFKTFTPKSTAT